MKLKNGSRRRRELVKEREKDRKEKEVLNSIVVDLEPFDIILITVNKLRL